MKSRIFSGWFVNKKHVQVLRVRELNYLFVKILTLQAVKIYVIIPSGIGLRFSYEIKQVKNIIL
eukprot:snap_masked-scaffold_77-processed-gene-0.40-mRNA-1 protein AED:1.00 eAED:1.00 QI:0/0/0/0/1/1/2/0/63